MTVLAYSASFAFGFFLLASFSGYEPVLQMDLLKENSLQKYSKNYFNIQFFRPQIPNSAVEDYES